MQNVAAIQGNVWAHTRELEAESPTHILAALWTEPDCLSRLTSARCDFVRDYRSARRALDTGNHDLFIVDARIEGSQSLVEMAVSRSVPSIAVAAPGVDLTELYGFIRSGIVSCVREDELPFFRSMLREATAENEAGLLGLAGHLRDRLCRVVGDGAERTLINGRWAALVSAVAEGSKCRVANHRAFRYQIL